MANVGMHLEREMRMHRSMRAKELTDQKLDQLPGKQAKTGGLQKADESRKQLVMSCEQLILRMALYKRGHMKLGKSFAKTRQENWKLLRDGEQKALKAEMLAKRSKGRAKQPADMFGAVREKKRKCAVESYGRS